MSKIANKQMICEVLMDAAKTDRDIVALCSDCLLYTSQSLDPFSGIARIYPRRKAGKGCSCPFSAGQDHPGTFCQQTFAAYPHSRHSRCLLYTSCISSSRVSSDIQ